MFLSSALKAQEEHYKLHTAMAIMKAKEGEDDSDIIDDPQPPAAASEGGSIAINSDPVRSTPLAYLLCVCPQKPTTDLPCADDDVCL